MKIYYDGLVQDCSISSVLVVEILQSCTNLLICNLLDWHQVCVISSMYCDTVALFLSIVYKPLL